MPTLTRHRASFVLASAMLLSLAACDRPIPGVKDPTVIPPQVHLTSHALSDDLYFQTPVVTRVVPGRWM